MEPIDYSKISEAVSFYVKKGFEYIEVPWLVSEKADSITRPDKRRAFSNFLGNHVASGEQSFLEMILKGDLREGKYVCVTPCFRDEPFLDEFHLNWFMKVELIDYLGKGFISDKEVNNSLNHILSSAKEFFSNYLDIEIVKTEEGLDIFGNDVELGSYGYRTYENFSWVYGTGLAEPRLSRVLRKSPKEILVNYLESGPGKRPRYFGKIIEGILDARDVEKYGIKLIFSKENVASEGHSVGRGLGYHLEEIPKGKYGELEKIIEELLEFRDAEKQGVKLMALQELSDLLGAVEGYLNKNYGDKISLDDLIKMKDVTKRVFENGYRS